MSYEGSGDEYIGDWAAGRRCGQGTLTCAVGLLKSGEWKVAPSPRLACPPPGPRQRLSFAPAAHASSPGAKGSTTTTQIQKCVEPF